MTRRRLPDLATLREQLRPKPIEWHARKRRLDAVQTIGDLRDLARRLTPRAVFDYTDGAAEAEISLRRARQTFAGLTFHPQILQDCGAIDTRTSYLGRPSAQPFGFAPTGFTRMMHHEGERAVARVAERIDVPYGLSTLGTTTIEDVAAAAPNARKWFQLYVHKDRSRSEDLIARSKAAGFEALMLTVDVPVAGARLRDKRNGLNIPPALSARTFLDGARHPGWVFNYLTTEPLRFAAESSTFTVTSGFDAFFDATMTYQDLAWLRSCWDGPLVVKGIQTVDDAKRCFDAGVTAIVLSNHGGRQLDRAPVPLRLLPQVRAAVGPEPEIYLDTGIMSGADVVAAVALGANAAFVGRAYLYGLMAGGEAGVQRAADVLAAEVRRTMALLGAATIADLGPHHVTLPA
jgi:L-lactate dehydrogenase (cytochrome)